MQRSRSSSISSVNSNDTTATNDTRRSSRVSKPTQSIKTSTVVKKKKKKNNKRTELENVEGNESDSSIRTTVSTSSKRYSRARSSTPSTSKLPQIKIKPLKAPIVGINSLPTLSKPPTSSDHYEVSLFVFGDGNFGQHGLGVNEEVLRQFGRPVKHSWNKSEIRDLVLGGSFTLLIQYEEGKAKVLSYGINDNAALGRSTVVEGIEPEILETKPLPVEVIEESFNPVKVVAGDSFSIALNGRGEIRCWGSFRGSEGILNLGAENLSQTQLKSHTITQVVAGDDHFLALTSTGYVFACGNGEQNQLGRKIIQRHKSHGLTPERLSLRNITLIGSGSFHSFCVNSTGQVYSFGLNSFNQTGISNSSGGWAETISSPTLVESLDSTKHNGSKLIQIEGGIGHSMFLFDNGEVWGCGRCDGYEIGLDRNHSSMIECDNKVEEGLRLRRIKEDEEKSRILESDEENELTEEEINLQAREFSIQSVSVSNYTIPIPTLIAFPSPPSTSDLTSTTTTKIISIACGPRNTFAISDQGLLYSWGFSSTGQLGLGESQSDSGEKVIEVPTLVEFGSKEEEGWKVWKCSGGSLHSAFLAVRDLE